MTPAEAAGLLTIAAGFDNRKPDANTAEAWALALDGLRYDDCKMVVVAHYQRSRDWLMPFDIITEVKRIRAKRLAETVVEPPPNADPDDTAGYMRWLAAARQQVADGDLPALDPRAELPTRDVAALGVVRTVADETAEERRRARRAIAAAHAALKAATPDLEPLPAQPTEETAVPITAETLPDERVTK